MPTITRDADLCKKCGTCVLICWPSVYVQETKDSIPEAINVGSCISCGHCVAICPKDAIAHSEFPKGYVKPLISENMPSSEEVLELLRTRRSTRFFKDRPVEKHLIEGIIEAARFAPSYLNLQTTEFIVIQDKKLLENIVQATGRYTAESVAKLHNPFIRRIVSIRMRVPARVITEEVLPHFDYVVAENKRINESRSSLQSRKAVLETQIQASREAAVSLPKLEEYIQLVREKLTDLDFDMKRLALDMLNIKIWVDGSSVEITGTIPVEASEVVTTSS